MEHHRIDNRTTMQCTREYTAADYSGLLPTIADRQFIRWLRAKRSSYPEQKERNIKTLAIVATLALAFLFFRRSEEAKPKETQSSVPKAPKNVDRQILKAIATTKSLLTNNIYILIGDDFMV